MKYKGFFYSVDIVRYRMRAVFGMLFALLARMKGVHFEGNVTIIGKPKFRLHPDTSVTIGRDCTFLSGATDNLIGINRPCILSTHNPGTSISIGRECGFSGTIIGAYSSIRIGDRVKCGANTLITDSNWHPEDPRSGVPRPVTIGSDVWLGVNAVVLKGVTIGDNVVIGANSVVASNIPSDSVAAGNPCKVIKKIEAIQHAGE